ncbi:hypothetical protein BGX38DRAFT_1327862 [Terfezia claveryi]|nr:hypothetical protein BGX38DRAFT_1327862 [Terfezia claveryi]
MLEELEIGGSAVVEEMVATVVEVVEEKVEEVLEPQETKKIKWQLWQDRLLAKQVLAEDPFGSARDMDEILIRSEQQARDPTVKAEAKRKLEKLEDDGKKIRDEAIRGQAKLNSVGKEKAKEKRQKRNNELQALQDLLEQLKKQEVEEKVLLETMRKEESEFRVTLL